jgi:anti-anti-sigma factor
LKIAGSLDVSTAGTLCDSLRDCLGWQAELSLDLSNVDSCDAAVLQLLCAARKTAAQLHKPFRVVSWSPAVLETCAALGIALEELAAQEGSGAV